MTENSRLLFENSRPRKKISHNNFIILFQVSIHHINARSYLWQGSILKQTNDTLFNVSFWTFL